MLGWARRLPAYALNGVSVSVGVALVQGLTSSFASAAFAQAASIGAVLASLPHLTGRAIPTLRRSLAGGLLGSLATLVMMLTADHAWLRGGAVALLSLLALMGMAWGARAAPIVFGVIIGMIFSLARPTSHDALPTALASAGGAALYAAWAFVNAKLLESRFRALSVASAVAALSALLRARAAVLTRAQGDSEAQAAALFGQLKEEKRLAQALQTARELLYPVATRGGVAVQIAIVSRVVELREILLTSRLDLDLLGGDQAGRSVLDQLALGLRKLSDALQQLARSQRLGSVPLAADLALVALPGLEVAENPFAASDPRARLAPVVAARLRYLREEVVAIRALTSGDATRGSIRPEHLRRYVIDDDTWPLSALRLHLTWSSPVSRHALRSALAFTSVYVLAYALPWTTRPYWMLLSVAVVLRGTLDDTLSRRNSRIVGTAIGCVLVTILVTQVADPLLKLTFIGAVGAAHAFVNVRYLLTAISGTVMALLQAHFAAPTTTSLVVERLLDTVIGALFAWAFSYVLPSWERRALPIAIERALQALRSYATCALEPRGASAEQRLARQRAYDALEVVAAALRRSAAEPRRVRPPVNELVIALEHAQRLMAHLSSLRSLLQRRGERLPAGEAAAALADARRRVDERLSLDAADEVRPPQSSYTELPPATVEVDPMPWLLRRLDASVHDAELAGRAVRRALNELRRAR
jgi:uncharacterized membrane protein YccC